jgi:hypothetical protein
MNNVTFNSNQVLLYYLLSETNGFHKMYTLSETEKLFRDLINCHFDTFDSSKLFPR